MTGQRWVFYVIVGILCILSSGLGGAWLASPDVESSLTVGGTVVAKLVINFCCGGVLVAAVLAMAAYYDVDKGLDVGLALAGVLLTVPVSYAMVAASAAGGLASAWGFLVGVTVVALIGAAVFRRDALLGNSK
ncbi:MAG: hypothetical protein PHR51_00045 [Patescibacteria group bacterium]|nr:hypothetical protein [Patescibacteria group bacterium]